MRPTRWTSTRSCRSCSATWRPFSRPARRGLATKAPPRPCSGSTSRSRHCGLAVACRNACPASAPRRRASSRRCSSAGDSPTVEQAIDAAGKRADITKRRALRSNFLSRAAVRHVLADQVLGGPALSDYRGDLQMHSTWSDGSMTLRELVNACAARGYAYSAVTDHSFGLPIAGGMSMTDVTKQHREIDRLNAGAPHFHLFKGIEANIGADGALDLSPEETRRFDVVLVAPHAKLRLLDDQTARLVRAIEHPDTHILAHPRGRMAGTRAGVVADWDEVFERAAAANVAVEIDGDPSRQDLDYDLASRALRAGCLFALDSDAHSPRELAYAETALAHARLASIPSEPNRELLGYRAVPPVAQRSGLSRGGRLPCGARLPSAIPRRIEAVTSRPRALEKPHVFERRQERMA